MNDLPLAKSSQPTAEGGLALALGARCAALGWADLPPLALHWAKVGIIDTLGVTLAGSREPAARLCAASLDLGDGPSLLLGSSFRGLFFLLVSFTKHSVARIYDKQETSKAD